MELVAVIASVSLAIVIVFVGIALGILASCLLRKNQQKNTSNTKYAMKHILSES